MLALFAVVVVHVPIILTAAKISSIERRYAILAADLSVILLVDFFFINVICACFVVAVGWWFSTLTIIMHNCDGDSVTLAILS